MDAAGGEFLARARRAGDQNPRIGRPDALDDVTQLVDHGGFADDPVGSAGPCAPLGDLALQSRGFERAFRDQHQAVRLERLFDEIIGAELYRGDRRLDIAVTGNHDDRQHRVLLLDDLQQLQAVES